MLSKSICINEEFNKAFDSYYKKISIFLEATKGLTPSLKPSHSKSSNSI